MYNIGPGLKESYPLSLRKINVYIKKKLANNVQSTFIETFRDIKINVLV